MLLQIGKSIKNQNRIANSIDPDETAHLELSSGSTLFGKVYFWSAGLKDLSGINVPEGFTSSFQMNLVPLVTTFFYIGATLIKGRFSPRGSKILPLRVTPKESIFPCQLVPLKLCLTFSAL